MTPGAPRTGCFCYCVFRNGNRLVTRATCDRMSTLLPIRVPLKDYIGLLATYLQMQRWRVLILAAILVTSIGLQLANPQIIRYFIDTAVSGGTGETLVRAAVAFFLLTLLQEAGTIMATYLSENIGWTATNSLRVDLAAHCLRLDMTFHKTRRPGELIERIDGDVTALSSFFSQFVIGVVSNLLLLLGVIFLLWLEDYRIGIIIAVFILFALYGMVTVHARVIPTWKAMRETAGKFFGFVGEHLAATEDIRGNGATDYVMYRLDMFLHDWFPIYRRTVKGWMALDASNRLTFGAGTAIAFALGAYLWGEGAATLGSIYIIFYYIGILQYPLTELRNKMQELQAATASILRVQELFSMQPKIVDGPGVPLPAGALRVRFDHLSFCYETSDSVLEDIDLELAPGRVLGLLGRTGSGKTTLARLLFRLYDPVQGEIRLDGVALPSTRLRELRGRVGMVTQDVQIFQATVRDNITFFDTSISDEKITRVLRELGLGDWYATLPDGLDTVLESGGGLSVGEGQLLAFARVFMQDPGLVILDEATAHLDPNTERLIEGAVSRLLHGRTGIIIAHRLATVERADEIMILENGRIVEHGERRVLMNDPSSRLAALLRFGLEEVLA